MLGVLGESHGFKLIHNRAWENPEKTFAIQFCLPWS